MARVGPGTGRKRMPRLLSLLWALLLIAGCAADGADPAQCPGPDCPGCPGPDCGVPPGKADAFNELNLSAGTDVIYEVQVRSANACHPQQGAEWQRRDCADKIAPAMTYHGPGCAELDELQAIRLGTFGDMLEATSDFRSGITLAYIEQRLGADTVWLMPIFPNNDRYDLPDGCDNLGSPYAVRDYLHARGTLSRRCIQAGRDEHSAVPCFGNQAFEQLIAAAHARGLKVMLDLAFNHFGHNYRMYDTAGHRPLRRRIAAGEDLERLWDFAATHEPALVEPALADTPAAIEALAAADPDSAAELDALRRRCPELEGAELVVAFHMWRAALDWERERFACEPLYLEHGLPGFYLGADRWNPSTGLGDNFSNEWRDVKFLFHQRSNPGHRHEYLRNREYLFRVMNYWVARGVDGFRLDHTTDGDSGLSAAEWDYIISKVDYYAHQRGQPRPLFLAEEFWDQQAMARVVDVMTEGYVFDMCGRDGVEKDAGHVEAVVANLDRFDGKTYVMTALETHDEHRLVEGTGFDAWTGAGFWGVGATTWSTPMLLMGQEFGEPWGLGFRRSDYLRARFVGSDNAHPEAEALVDFYRAMIDARLGWANRALFSAPRHFLRTAAGERDPRIFAQVKWSGDGNVVFVFHNLWRQDVSQVYTIPDAVADALWLRPERDYRLVDALTDQPHGPCRPGAELQRDLAVDLPAGQRLLWLRLEACD